MFERQVIGYADKLSVAPGEDIAFKVSSETAGTFEAELVRLTGGDDPGGAGFSETVVPSNIRGTYPARFQPLRPGSFARVTDDEDVLTQISGFTMHVVACPTVPRLGRRQVLMGNRNSDANTGVALTIEADGAPALVVAHGASGGETVVSTGIALAPSQWSAIAATYDPEIGRVQITQQGLDAGVGSVLSAASGASLVDEVPPPGAPATGPATPFLFAASWAHDRAAEHYNGKLDSPRLIGVPVTVEDHPTLRAPEPAASYTDDVVGWWDFSRGINTEQIVDAGPHGLHGETVQMPARAVTGWRWTGDAHRWQDAPDHYGAIHFHDDDLVDAGWDDDFVLTVPADCVSGVYAARVRQGDPEGDEHIVFFVRPPRQTRYVRGEGGIAFLAPTASYLAYANYRLRLKPNPILGSGEPKCANDAYLRAHPELGASLYDVHSDWSGVHISSRHRPLTNVRPRQNRIWGFPADMNIIAWLEQTGLGYEVITDEDLHAEGGEILGRYRAVITGSHPEYYSTRMLDGVDEYLRDGGRLMYMGGNGFYWRIAYHSTTPGIIEVRRAEDGTRAWIAEPGQYYQSFNGEYGGLWRRIGRAPNQTVGIGFAAQGFETSAPYIRGPGADNPRASFVFDGVPDKVIGDFGSLGGGASGEEIDRFDIRLGSPAHGLVLASAMDHDDAMLRTKEEFLSTIPSFRDPKIRSDLVFFECPNGGAVFSTGSIAWSASLAHNGFDNNVARITENVLRRFADPEPIPPPS